MTIWIVVLALPGLEVVFSSPRQSQSSVSFLVVGNQNIDAPDAILLNDPDLIFLKTTPSNTPLTMPSHSLMNVTVWTSPSLLQMTRMSIFMRMQSSIN